MDDSGELVLKIVILGFVKETTDLHFNLRIKTETLLKDVSNNISEERMKYWNKRIEDCVDALWSEVTGAIKIS